MRNPSYYERVRKVLILSLGSWTSIEPGSFEQLDSSSFSVAPLGRPTRRILIPESSLVAVEIETEL